ncbi:xylulokinase [Micromonospora nigra]|uniref:Xylulokinase n=1 Tax=Micromonospora nigra TaxID=145857 RepID=A0A1C6RD28_9ACTN|nr:FGGY-family carbohydrate kinase [Micromonospora nigra]SCL15010.1 xylulokinase [Micromonospora nigra]
MTADRVVGVDVGGSSVKVWLADPRGVRTRVAALPTLRPSPTRAEFDPAVWWAVIRRELRALIDEAGPGDLLGLVVSTMRQAFVLIDDRRELGNGILNSDRRGAATLDRLRERPDLYPVTGHWPAPELTLGKLLAVAADEPERWTATRRVLFVHDWVVWRLTGAQATEVSYACAGQLADVARRDWAVGVLTGFGLDTGKLAGLVEPGTPVGGLTDDTLGLPVGLPVHAGCGDTQLAAMGAGGLAEGVVTVVAGSSTPVQIATDRPLADPLCRPWVSTHARRDLWAAETNAGYPGTMGDWLRRLLGPIERSGRPGAGGLTAVVATPHWTEHDWSTKAPMTVLGLGPATRPEDLAQAFAEAHAYAVWSNLSDLEQVQGRPARRVVLTGGGAESLAPLLADVSGRSVEICPGAHGTSRAGWALVTGAAPAGVPTSLVAPRLGPDPYADAYQRYLATHGVLRAGLAEEER